MHIHDALRDSEHITNTQTYGFLETEHLALWSHYQQEQAYRDDPFHIGYFQSMGGGLWTKELLSVVEKRDWYRSRHYNEYIKPCNLGDRITSSQKLPDHSLGLATQTLVLHADNEDGSFSSGARYLVHLFHFELLKRMGRTLHLPGSEHDVTRLPPRLQQVLEGVLDGYSDKHMLTR